VEYWLETVGNSSILMIHPNSLKEAQISLNCSLFSEEAKSSNYHRVAPTFNMVGDCLFAISAKI